MYFWLDAASHFSCFSPRAAADEASVYERAVFHRNCFWTPKFEFCVIFACHEIVLF